jgi:hypothetical protein
MAPRITDPDRLAAELELLGILGDPTARGPLVEVFAPPLPAPHGVVITDTPRGERPLRRRLTTLGRRTLVSTLLGAVVLPLRALRRAAGAGEPGPADPCHKLGGKCAVNSDCCGPGTRCKKVGNGKCRCKRDRAPCAGICCPVGQGCCGRCADLQTDTNHCGACFTVCGADLTCVAGSCTS